ncbi:AsmA family protein [Aliivibrio fischeri]
MYTTLKSLGWLITFCLLLVVAFLALLHTPYAQPVLNPLVQKLSHQKISFGELNYSIQSPLHLTLSDVSIESEKNINIQQVDFWLSQHPIQNNKLAFDSVKIDGISLQTGLPNTQQLDWLSIAQLSISNLDFADDGLVIREAQVQLSNWSIDKTKTLPFEGEFQFSTQQLYWQSEALDDVLIDGYYSQDYTALDGISLTWRGSTITAQAELKENKLWVIPQFTLRRFNLESDNADIIGKPLQWLSEQHFTYQFKRIDLLNINLELPQIITNDLSLSAENILLPYDLWEQTNANISLNADSIVWNETMIEKPIMDVTLNKKEANIENLSFDIFNGNIQLSGDLSPHKINLKSLTISQIRWLIDNKDTDSIVQYIKQLEQVKIDNVDINNVQVIQPEGKYPYQVSGLNAEGHDLDLLKYYQWDYGMENYL